MLANRHFNFRANILSLVLEVIKLYNILQVLTLCIYMYLLANPITWNIISFLFFSFFPHREVEELVDFEDLSQSKEPFSSIFTYFSILKHCKPFDPILKRIEGII